MEHSYALAPAVLVSALSVGFAMPAYATAPEIQTQGPIIYLADNLQEDAKLGWCIDTEGRGFAETLHAHSCKPTGNDVLFTYAPDTGTIASSTYENKCMAYNAPENAVNPFGLIDCDSAAENQRFSYDADSLEMHLGNDETLCLTVAPTIDDAGPFQSRDLILAACGGLEPSFKQWIVQK